MLLLLIAYFIFLVLYGIISYAIIFHFLRYRVEGDKSQLVINIYVFLSIIIILGSFLFIRPA